MAFTLNKLVATMRGLPGDTRVLVRLPDGRVVDIGSAIATHLNAGETAAGGADYGIVLEVELGE